MTERFALIRVLVVNNNEAELEQMVIYLQRLGVVYYETVGNSNEALTRLLDSRHNFHIVFTDKNRLDLVLSIREHDHLNHVKVAMISGDFSHQTEPPAKELTFRQFLQRRQVLPIPSKGLDASVLGRAMGELSSS